jgi:hypothetical protein
MFERDDDTRERCDCHVCSTLRAVLSANFEATHDSRSPTPLLLTYGQAAELMGVTADVVSGLVREGELRPVGASGPRAVGPALHGRPAHVPAQGWPHHAADRRLAPG